MHIEISGPSASHSPAVERRIIQTVLRRAAERLRLAPGAACSVVWVSPALIRSRNRRYRRRDQATTALAFPAHRGTPSRLLRQFRRSSADRVAQHLGEIYLCRPRILAAARLANLPPASYLTQLIVHSLLHLIGYAHDRLPDHRNMERAARRILATPRYGKNPTNHL